MKTKFYLSIIIIFISMVGCKHDDEQNDDINIETVSFTMFGNHSELFVEFTPLVVGNETNFLSHFNVLQNFKPITEGTLRVELIGSDPTITQTVHAPAKPGIFKISLKAEQSGYHQLKFTIETKNFTDVFAIDSIMVFADEITAKNQQPDEQPEGEITFLKEQAWNIDYETKVVEEVPFFEVIKTTGKIIPAPGNEAIITAKSNGIITLNGNNLIQGKNVLAGTTLCTISGEGLAEGSVTSRFNDLKNNFTKSKSAYQRAEILSVTKAISEKEFIEIKTEYLADSVGYYSFANNYSENGIKITMPQSGFVKEVFVQEGEYVEAGQTIATVGNNLKMTLKAEMLANMYPKLKKVFSCNFKTPYSEKIYLLEDMKGKLISTSHKVDENDFFTHVYFEFENNGEILEGTFVEVYLKINQQQEALIVPKSALLEEQGILFLYLQISGESFTKREVKIGGSDGLYYQIIDGLAKGDRVVTKGVHQIRLASLAGSLPLHGHTH
ncbi:MAG: efflux RND transporter periplasmic adaptor subunit [Bacteroidota bacterium]|nr:efflux RND transporter periplasmic adaptor subunit [Bacteroidota bacterium]